MSFHCDKHGEYGVFHNTTDARCPACESEYKEMCAAAQQREPKATQALKDLVRDYGGHGTPTLPEPVQAVLTAVDGWRRARINSNPGEAGSYNGKSEAWWSHDVLAAYEAYRAQQKPVAVLPEEVEPGTRFRFEDQLSGRTVTGGKLVMVVRGHDWQHAWEDGEARVWQFDESDRIIPTKES
jgi:hypothetical protein